MRLTYDISQLSAYINWPYFFYAWQVREPAEKERLRREADLMLILTAMTFLSVLASASRVCASRRKVVATSAFPILSVRTMSSRFLR